MSLHPVFGPPSKNPRPRCTESHGPYDEPPSRDIHIVCGSCRLTLGFLETEKEYDDRVTKLEKAEEMISELTKQISMLEQNNIELANLIHEQKVKARNLEKEIDQKTMDALNKS